MSSTAEQFKRYQESPASHLRYEQAQRNLVELHDLKSPLRVLDAAGGNGLNTEFMLQRGHTVTLLDNDPEMLKQAKERIGPMGLLARCTLVDGTVEGVADQVPHNHFDLVICHHAIEYTKEAPAVLRAFGKVLRSGGELSLVTLNPVSEVIRAIVFKHDPELARSRVTDLRYDARWFGNAIMYTFEDVVRWGEEAGLKLRDYRAIRVLADLLGERLTSANEESALKLELELAGREPYRRFGRYFQLCMRKS